MKVLQIKLNVMGDINDVKLMEALSETILKSGVKYWSAEVNALFDLDDEEIETLKSQSKEPEEPIPQSIFNDPDVLRGKEDEQHRFFEDVGELRYGPMATVCGMCTKCADPCMNLEFSKMDVIASNLPYIMVSCEFFSLPED